LEHRGVALGFRPPQYQFRPAVVRDGHGGPVRYARERHAGREDRGLSVPRGRRGAGQNRRDRASDRPPAHRPEPAGSVSPGRPASRQSTSRWARIGPRFPGGRARRTPGLPTSCLRNVSFISSSRCFLVLRDVTASRAIFCASMMSATARARAQTFVSGGSSPSCDLSRPGGPSINRLVRKTAVCTGLELPTRTL
jgi:hypothetical protein